MWRHGFGAPLGALCGFSRGGDHIACTSLHSCWGPSCAVFSPGHPGLMPDGPRARKRLPGAQKTENGSIESVYDECERRLRIRTCTQKRYGNVRSPSGGRAWEGPPPRATTGGPPASLIQQLPTDQFLNGLVSGAQPEAWARPVDPPGSLFGHSAPALPMKRAGRGIMPETRITRNIRYDMI